MSRLSLTTNIASMNAQRNFTRASKDLETSFNRLSSGMRINRASDDAAGLSVSSLLNADRAVLAQGIRNLNDGISYLNIAEGAITELTNIMFRIQEIAEQSANGTLSSTQRKPLQDEVTALQNEYNRIIESTRFNGMQLLTGANTLVNLQGGYGVAGGLAVQVGNELSSDAFGLYSSGETLRVSTTAGGGEANGQSQVLSVSADGRYVAFWSDATNLVSGVSGQQVYIKDTLTGEVKVGSSSSDGVVGDLASDDATLSADGRYLVFRSRSNNLVAENTYGNWQVYAKDLQTGALKLVSSEQNGAAGHSTSSQGNISADGRYVLFTSNSTNLLGINGTHVYMKDLQTGAVTIQSVNENGEEGDEGSNRGVFSQDQSFLIFYSSATNLIPGISSGQFYIRNLETGELKLGSSGDDWGYINGWSFHQSLSANGRYLAFWSTATNLLPGVSGGQIFVKDLETGKVQLASSTKDGVQGDGASNAGTSISADGRYLSFSSNSSNLIDGVSGWQVYRKDMLTGDIELVSRSTSGEVDSVIQTPSFITADGSKVFFSSDSTSLVAGDSNGVADIFMRDLSKTGIDGLSGMVVQNQMSARVTLMLAKDRLDTLNLTRAGIGASSSRIDTAISNLSTMTQNLASAASQITDTDVADESAKLAAKQILQQSGAAVLSQANLQPQLVLTLLKDI